MTQEEKSILIKDLSARLPYYPKCEMIDEVRVVNNEKDPSYISTLFPKHIELFSYHNNFTIKPYLRPMSLMTEEEKKELWELLKKLGMPADVKRLDWLIAHHFDYRGLIERGLAIDCTGLNIY